MPIVIKPMETEEEIRGKALVHWRCWQEVYRGLVSAGYLERFTREKSEEIAHRFLDNHLIAKDGDRVVGFLSYGDRGAEASGVGEVFALYVLPEYHGAGVGQQLMAAGLDALATYPRTCLWVLKDNGRAIRFYEKCGFRRTGEELFSPSIEATEIRMIREN